jgi:medium-chain acyl-[acyl-carrier-protein] hydrolase
MRLFCFPCAGGNAASFLPWQALVGSQLEIQVAVLPGRGTRLFEEPVDDMDELVAGLAAAITRFTAKRFAFFGHSLGALLAFEVTRALRRQDLPVPDSLWVAGAEGPQTRFVGRHLHELPEAELIDALREYNGTPTDVLDEREMMELLLPGIRADFALSETYVYRAEAPLDLPIHVLRGDEDPFVEAPRAAGWSRESSRPPHEHVYAGDHFFIRPHQAAIAALLAATMTAGTTGSQAPA